MNTDEINLNNEVNRGELARQVTDNPVYREAFIMMNAQLMSDFQDTKFKQQDERDEIWRKMQTLNRFESFFEQLMENGKFADATLRQKLKKVVGFR